MKKQQKNYAFIDAQNLYFSIKKQWWELDYNRFFIYLRDKFWVKKVFMCIWYLPWNENLYKKLQEIWYILVLKPTLELKSWVIKWNVDAELVLYTMIEYGNFEKAVIISWDWDFHCLVEYLEKKGKLERVIIPNQKKYSSLLKKFNKYLFFLSVKSLRNKIWKQKIRKQKKKVKS